MIPSSGITAPPVWCAGFGSRARPAGAPGTRTAQPPSCRRTVLRACWVTGMSPSCAPTTVMEPVALLSKRRSTSRPRAASHSAVCVPWPTSRCSICIPPASPLALMVIAVVAVMRARRRPATTVSPAYVERISWRWVMLSAPSWSVMSTVSTHVAPGRTAVSGRRMKTSWNRVLAVVTSRRLRPNSGSDTRVRRPALVSVSRAGSRGIALLSTPLVPVCGLDICPFSAVMVSVASSPPSAAFASASRLVAFRSNTTSIGPMPGMSMRTWPLSVATYVSGAGCAAYASVTAAGPGAVAAGPGLAPGAQPSRVVARMSVALRVQVMLPYREGGRCPRLSRLGSRRARSSMSVVERRSWWRTRAVLGTVLLWAFVLACVRLGFWQLDRLEQRRALNTRIARRLAALPLAGRALLEDTSAAHYRRVHVAGQYDDARAIVLPGRSYRGIPGVHLLTPLRLDGDAAVLVNRGWVASADAATIPLDWLPAVPPGQAPDATVSGLGLPLPLAPRGARPAADSAFRRVWYRLDLHALQRQFPYRILPVELQLLPAPDAPT
ncbi:MAG: SURF1 family protein, partial [Gemmatimonadetes bacterium]|nr:SURF1 family protein [Gemmatimonadota bacterium]